MKKDKIKICEIFKSIQGEGRYQGYPALFVRVSGCTRKCSTCDTKYHINGKVWKVKDLASKICAMLTLKPVDIVVYSGGEPLLYLSQIKKLNRYIKEYFPYTELHVETNGDLIKNDWDTDSLISNFSYICISPKDVKTAKRIHKLFSPWLDVYYDIKVVTDLEKVGVDLIPYATMLQPLTTYNKKRDLKIKQRVWEYCVQHGLFYSGRLHVEVWGKKKGV